MLEKGNMLYLYAETPFHPGSGGSLGYVDLPVQREVHTRFPVFQASGLKGVLRETAFAFSNSKDHVNLIFGPEDGAEHAGCISVGDARILLFPVRSLMGVFAWVTCPMVIQRLLRDYTAAFTSPLDIKCREVKEGYANVCSRSALIIPEGQAGKSASKIVLEEYDFIAMAGDAETDILAKWIADNVIPASSEYASWRERIQQQFAIVSDDAFTTFVNFNTMVVNRTQLDDIKKVVKTGALWTEENLPPDTVLYAPVFASRPRKENKDNKIPPDILTIDGVLNWLQQNIKGRIIAGGDSTVGRGVLCIRWQGGVQ